MVCQDFLESLNEFWAGNRDVRRLHTPRPPEGRVLPNFGFWVLSVGKSCLRPNHCSLTDLEPFAKFQQWSAKTFSKVWTNFELVIEMYDGYIPLDRRKRKFYPTFDFGCPLLTKWSLVNHDLVIIFQNLSNGLSKKIYDSKGFLELNTRTGHWLHAPGPPQEITYFQWNTQRTRVDVDHNMGCLSRLWDNL